MPLHHLSHADLQHGHFVHLRRVPGTRTVEALGLALMSATGSPTGSDWLSFSKDVCRWGGRTGGRVFGQIQKNPSSTIAAAFAASVAQLRLGPRSLLAAKLALGPIKGLGSFSYASKHLRMLCPEVSPVLDDVVDGYLTAASPRYARSPIAQRFTGYADFCQTTAQRLTKAGVKLGDHLTSVPTGGVQTTVVPAQCAWTAGDVDMACFAWIRRWFATTSTPHSPSAVAVPSMAAPGGAQLPQGQPTADRTSKRIIYLAQDHEHDTAVTIKERCGVRWNNAWICRSHGSLDLKREHAKGTTIYLIGEMHDLGYDVTLDPRWRPSPSGTTCHHGGVSYEGRLVLGTVAEAVRLLKQYFDVRACPTNRTETQAWVDSL